MAIAHTLYVRMNRQLDLDRARDLRIHSDTLKDMVDYLNKTLPCPVCRSRQSTVYWNRSLQTHEHDGKILLHCSMCDTRFILDRISPDIYKVENVHLGLAREHEYSNYSNDHEEIRSFTISEAWYRNIGSFNMGQNPTCPHCHERSIFLKIPGHTTVKNNTIQTNMKVQCTQCRIELEMELDTSIDPEFHVRRASIPPEPSRLVVNTPLPPMQIVQQTTQYVHPTDASQFIIQTPEHTIQVQSHSVQLSPEMEKRINDEIERRINERLQQAGMTNGPESAPPVRPGRSISIHPNSIQSDDNNKHAE